MVWPTPKLWSCETMRQSSDWLAHITRSELRKGQAHMQNTCPLNLFSSIPLPVPFPIALAQWCHMEGGGDCGSRRVSGNWKAGWLAVLRLYCIYWDDRIKVCFNKSGNREADLFLMILLPPMFGFLLALFTPAGVEEDFPYCHYRKQSEKRKRRSSWAQSQRATALLLWIIHSHSDRTWMAWLQLLTCAITLTLSITHFLSPSLTPLQTHMHWKTDTHTQCFPLRTILQGYVKTDSIWSLQSTAGLLYSRQKWALQPIIWIYQGEQGNSLSQVFNS